ncbi:hypothetical protein LJC60_03610 [Ruminococcaceae bacterium OttesenSCG-928-D13]|nr:hypothetical protein [Ruminococcaceae bacterium OttesenSCG-928-D13]
MKPLKQKPKRRGKLLALCYAAALLVWLALCGARLALDTAHIGSGELPRLELGFADFQPSGLFDGAERDLPGTIISTDPDSQLIYEQAGGFYATRVVFDAAPLNKGAGEIVLYYTTRPADSAGRPQDFSEARKVWARQDAAGRWVFDLDGRKVYRLRLDPDTTGGVVWRFNGVILNERVPVAFYFLPDLRQGVLLALLPLLFWAALCELLAFLQPLLARRRFERKWGEMGNP